MLAIQGHHPVQQFLDMLSTFRDYPADVVPVPELLPGTAAFAASVGLYRPPKSTELPHFPYRGLMIVGHNLDSVDNYEVRRRTGVSHGDRVPGHRTMSTWTGLYKLLELAAVPLDQFFFTNVFLGLKQGKPTGTMTRHPAPEYRQFCRYFLRAQIDEMRPSVVLVLGEPAWTNLCTVLEDPPWPPGRLPEPAAAQVAIFGHRTTVVAAQHTSMPRRIADDSAVLRSAWSETVSGRE